MSANQKNQNDENESGLQNYARYSGLAFQMIAVILAFVWAGKKLDDIYLDGRSVFIIIFSLLGVGIAMYLAIKDLLKINKKK